MALSATIFKVNVNISNFNNDYYDDYNLTMAMHPSENENRLIVRLLAFLWCAHQKLEFTKGLCDSDEPEIWSKGLSGEIIDWIDLGQPDEKRLKQSCSKAQNVFVFSYNMNTHDKWFDKIKNKCTNLQNLNLFKIESQNETIEDFIQKSMRLTCTIDGEHLYLASETSQLEYLIKKIN